MTSGRVDQASVPGALRNHARRISILEALTPNNNVPWILLQGTSLNGTSVPSGSDTFIPLTLLLVSPLNAGGNIDANVYGGISPGGAHIPVMTGGSSNEPFKAIELLQPGLYYYEIGIGWYLNWGGVRVNYDVTHSDAFTSVVNFRVFINGTDNSYFGGASDPTARQIVATARSFMAVDDRATNVQVRGFVHNFSGVTRTYGTTVGVDIGNFSLFIIRLSPSPNSNPAYP
jgi:hypothetical protein